MQRTRLATLLTLAAVALLPAGRAIAQDAQRLNDFETPADVKAWSIGAGSARLVAEPVAHGKSALEIRFDPKGQYHPAYLNWSRPRRDWSGFDALALEVFNPNDRPITGYLLIADQAWRDKGLTYWNRHNSSTVFPPGRTSWVIPVGGLYRGEAGSRNNDIKRNIDIDQIVRLDFGFGDKGQSGAVVIDDLRLIRVARPAGVWAFDFGPPDQSVMLGWTGASHQSRYDKGRGFGWGPAGGSPWDGAARDTTFGPPLIRDFCQAGGYRFRIDVPPGRYRVSCLFENSGYWGGEQAQQTTRRILVDGKAVWSETRRDGSAHSLFRFEDVEPVGVDLWDTYMKDELARVERFDVTAGGAGLTLQFEADRPWGAKLSALVVHRADDAAAARWLDGQLAALAEEFRARAVCMDKPAGPFALPPAWQPHKLAAWAVDLERDVTPHSLPPADPPPPGQIALSRLIARGQTAAFSLAVRTPQPTGDAALSFAWTQTPPGGKLDAKLATVWYNARRGFNSLAYRIEPHTVRPATSARLLADVTRQIVLTVAVPDQAAPGEYRGELTIAPPAARPLRVPVTLRVSAVVADRDSEFRFGFFGLRPPGHLPASRQSQVLDQTLALLREHGMNTVSGGPNWTLTGWKNGQPTLDVAEFDAFVALLKKHGFDGPINGYGGPRFVGLHDGYQIGASRQRVESESGLPYEQAFLRAWAALDAHGRANGWPVVWYAMCDETRVRDVAERELELMKLMARASAAHPATLQSSGSYSVTFKSRPTDRDDLLYWHQRFFEALDISDLNLHDETVLAEAKKLGKRVHIYNQGVSRFSFGLYQWAEFSRGVRARTQWHLNILHGYQFFDLDGREPDTAMICYGRNAIYPTIEFERCRDGAQDFYLLNTLHKKTEAARAAGRDTKELRAAESLLAALAARVPLNRRQPPDGYDADAMAGDVLRAIESLGP